MLIQNQIQMLTITNNKIIKDPIQMSGPDISSEEYDLVSTQLKQATINFSVPDHIATNKLKTEYRSGFISELYGIFFPEMKKHEVFSEITKNYHIFVDERAFQKHVKEYTEKKHSIFVK